MNGPRDVESTATLLARVRSGDPSARDQLARHYLPLLQSWASGRLPPWARALADTSDLVQETLLRALERVEEFEPRREGAFLAYLRQILLNKVRDQIRSRGRRPEQEALESQIPGGGQSPLEMAIGSETLRRYERALEMLTDEQREAVILRLEFDYSYPQVADAMESPSPNAARMLVARGLTRMAEVMEDLHEA